MSGTYTRRLASGTRSGRRFRAMGELVNGSPARYRTPGPLAQPPGTVGTVRCGDCGTWVTALVSGRPRSHAAGGYGATVRNGHPPCPTSGGLARLT